MIALLIVEGLKNEASTRNAGVPSGGYTGSPADGVTCGNSNCHNVSPTSKSGWITSDIPSSGYVPGQTYTITANPVKSGINKFGFEVTAEDNSQNKVGNIIITNTTETQTRNSGTSITHTGSGTSGSGSKSWSFDWTAPSSGTGDVTFYGAFNATNGNNQPTGDEIFTSSLTVQEDVTTSVAAIANKAQELSLKVFPNPADGPVNLIYQAPSVEKVRIAVLNSSGQLVREEFLPAGKGNARHRIDLGGMASGSYYLQMEQGESSTLQPFFLRP